MPFYTCENSGNKINFIELEFAAVIIILRLFPSRSFALIDIVETRLSNASRQSDGRKK